MKKPLNFCLGISIIEIIDIWIDIYNSAFYILQNTI